jgi:hypothetical protein
MHDKKHALGGLMAKTWSYNFEEMLEVIRAHPRAGVARLFLSMKCYKAAAMNLTMMLAAFLKNNSPLNISTGVYRVVKAHLPPSLFEMMDRFRAKWEWVLRPIVSRREPTPH